MAAGWVNTSLAVLPGTNDGLFQKLWTEKKLLFEGQHEVADTVDECSARLVAAALKAHEPLFIVLPDFRPHRPALLFSTGLLRYWFDSRSRSTIQDTGLRPILYFGSTVGIRDQLRKTTVAQLHMSLSEVFGQRDVSRGATGDRMAGLKSDDKKPNLPSVITVYSPADPVTIIRAHKPSWIAVDCADVPSLNWLGSLLGEAVRFNIPIIAWGQNPLSECVTEFDNIRRTFIWPLSIRLENNKPGTFEKDAETLLGVYNPTALMPVVIVGEGSCAFSNSIREAGQLLGHIKQTLPGQFTRDAVAVHWKYLRSLEVLSVPIGFYEAEAPRLWGLKSFGQLGSACDYFRRACENIDSHLYGELEHVGGLLSEARAFLENKSCVLWDALSNFCVESPPDEEARIIVFTSAARKRLFVFSLLARYNIAEEDLRELRTYVASLDEYRRWVYYRDFPHEGELIDGLSMPPGDLMWHPIIVGLPSPAAIPKLMSIFLERNVDIVLYPHQRSLFIRRQTEWAERLTANGKRINWNIARLGGLGEPDSVAYPPRLALAEAIEMNAETASKIKVPHTGPLWTPEDTADEVARLFQTEDESTEGESSLSDHAEGSALAQAEEPEDIWVREAIKVQFESGWHAFFSPNDVINVIQERSLDPRYVRSLAGAERVLLINGQARQSVYDLIISRIHRHPSIELHLAMIRRWQEDYRIAFHQWKAQSPEIDERREHGARDLDGLLRRLQALGSHLISATTLYFWLNGLVLCPLNPEDLRRLADVLKMSFVRQYYGRISKAAIRLRALHRSLSIKLNHWLEDQASGELQKRDDDMIDAELGLTFGDVRNSLLVLRVVGIQKVAGPFLRSTLGQAQKDTGL
jgi:hypothetical protein